ncbi:hypothetical protein GCM10022206_40750 [Streptomyces chiangmaiensis]
MVAGWRRTVPARLLRRLSMAEPNKKPLRQIARPFVTGGPSGVSIRDRLGA